MELVTLFIGVFLLCSSVPSGYSEDHGHVPIIDKFPYQVSVEVDGKPKCGGAIIGDQWVITANSCVPHDVTQVNRVGIRAGSAKLGTGGAFYTVSKMARYNFSYFIVQDDLDMGLIKVDVPFVYASNIQWARPAIEYLDESDKIEVAGWGLKGRSNQVSAGARMQSANVKKIPHHECQQKFQGKVKLTKSMACLVPASSRDNPCVADVGSPVAVSGMIAAVVSNNEYCWNSSLPLLVTDIGDGGFFLTFTVSEPRLRV